MFENCQKRGKEGGTKGVGGSRGVIVVTKAKKWGQGIDGYVCLSVRLSVCPYGRPSFDPFVSLFGAAGREDEKRINTL